MSDSMMNKAVILARGLGTRMRKADDGAELTAEQAAIAETGVKAMIPIDRPFLDYVLHDLAKAGYEQICLVIGPEHDAVRDYYGNLACDRLTIHFAVQEKPLGTANAVVAAEEFAGNDSVLVINSDNYYPMAALRGLRDLDSSGLAAFDRDAMLAGSNIPADRITKFAVIEVDSDGYMSRIIEKPSAEQIAALPEPVGVSMNCWRFGPKIYEACKAIDLSPRGEYEITDAVQYAIDVLGERFKALTCAAPVLDLSSRSDVASVTEKLRGMELSL
ncbi:MAG: nucleotidyltransferase family protein [Sedimentisphaerales bacterium]|nr:nucleotidyltransferase family protein [Sedimentisphaerales bacterium]